MVEVVAKKKRKLKKKVLYFIITFLLIIFICVFLLIKYKDTDFVKTTIEVTNNFFNKVDNVVNEEKVLEEKYLACMSNRYSEDELTEGMKQQVISLNNYLKKYNTSVYYEDSNSGYSFIYNDNVDYYAASTIKMLDAIYIYKKAIAGELNLDDTVIYKYKHVISSSPGVKQYKIVDGITLRNLVKYAIVYSDNSAHAMLVDYIGYSNLKQFGKSLGATKTLYGGDNFGTTNVYDSMVYVKELDKLIKSNSSLGEELKGYFISSDDNFLDFSDKGISAATKYGHYSNYSHNQGIVYDLHPYYLVVLTRASEKNFESTISDISTKIYELHSSFYTNRDAVCKNQVYGK